MKSLSASLASSFLFLGAEWNVQAFPQASPGLVGPHRLNVLSAANLLPDEESSSFPLDNAAGHHPRRDALGRLAFGAAAAVASLSLPSAAFADETKYIQEYPDFTQNDEGFSYKDVKEGSGEFPKKGDRVVYEWSGYTIGYFGRPFEAKGGPKGGAFDKDIDYSRTVLGSGTIVKGLDCAFTSMKPGGIRQVVVPYGDLGYPADDSSHERVGPKPTTFSGMRALNFVLENPRVDRTMLFNVKLVRVDRPDSKGSFLRGDKKA